MANCTGVQGEYEERRENFKGEFNGRPVASQPGFAPTTRPQKKLSLLATAFVCETTTHQ